MITLITLIQLQGVFIYFIGIRSSSRQSLRSIWKQKFSQDQNQSQTATRPTL